MARSIVEGAKKLYANGDAGSIQAETSGFEIPGSFEYAYHQ
jgi:hypothetical protein